MNRVHLIFGACAFVIASASCLAGDGGDWLSAGSSLPRPSDRRPRQPRRPARRTCPGRSGGPAYPGDFWRSFGRDVKELPATLWDDTKVTFTSPTSWVLFGLAGAAGIALHGHNGDAQIADHYTRHGSQLNTFWDSVGDAGGNPGTHFAVAGAVYLWSLAKGDTRTYEVSKTLLNALIINGLFTEALKVAAHTDSPNGDELRLAQRAHVQQLLLRHGDVRGLRALGGRAAVRLRRLRGLRADRRPQPRLLRRHLRRADRRRHRPRRGRRTTSPGSWAWTWCPTSTPKTGPWASR